jgi:hypothetical protein
MQYGIRSDKVNVSDEIQPDGTAITLLTYNHKVWFEWRIGLRFPARAVIILFVTLSRLALGLTKPPIQRVSRIP